MLDLTLVKRSVVPESFLPVRQIRNIAGDKARCEASVFYAVNSRMTNDWQSFRSATKQIKHLAKTCLGNTPFECLKQAIEQGRTASNLLSIFGSSMQNYKGSALTSLCMSDIDVSTCSIEEMMQHDHVGEKIARLSAMMNGLNDDVACIDPCIARWMKYYCDVDHIPSNGDLVGDEYLKAEDEFRNICKCRLGNIPMPDAHVLIWRFGHGVGGMLMTPEEFRKKIENGEIPIIRSWNDIGINDRPIF